MSYIKSETSKITEEDKTTGDIIIQTKEKTTKIERCEEPDYIKLYTKMWCEFNNIPEKYRQLFLSLATRMSYCDAQNIEVSQIVTVIEPVSTMIREECGWKTKDALLKGLKCLCECKAIKRINRGVYQINPSYASRGSWKYNPRLQHGGVEDLIATFDFKNKTVDTTITFCSNKNTDIINKITDITTSDEETPA